MKIKLYFILFLSIFFVGAVEFTPGLKGMFSFSDITERPQNSLYKSVNVSQSRKPGALTNRLTLTHRGLNHSKSDFYKTVGFYDETFDKSLLIGFRSLLLDSFNTYPPLPAASYYFTTDTRHLVTLFASPDRLFSFFNSWSDTIIKEDDDVSSHSDIPYERLMSDRYGIDACIVPDGIIFSDGFGMPIFVRTISIDDNDAKEYRLNARSLSFTAPGQLKAQTLDDTGLVFGFVQYRLVYFYDKTYPIVDYTGEPGRASAGVFADSQSVLVSCFQDRAYPTPYTDTVASKINYGILLKNTDYDSSWYIVDTITWVQTNTYSYIDSTSDTGLYNLIYSFDVTSTQNVDSIPIPGQMIRDTGSDFNRTFQDNYDTTISYDFDIFDTSTADTYYIAYSFYDPLSGAESQLSPLTQVLNPFTYDIGTSRYFVPYMTPTLAPFQHSNRVRFYRSLSNDSTVLYGLWQFRINTASLLGGIYSPPFTRYFYPQFISDPNLVTIVKDSTLSKCFNLYSDDQLFYDGITIQIRPPYKSYLEVPLSDVEFVNFRLWGIGDPLFKSRLYYSEYDDFFSWNPGDYFDLNLDGQYPLVALAHLSLGTSQVLFAFKNNFIYRLTGYDAEHDVQIALIPSSGVGLLNRRSFVLANNIVYFLTPDLEIYALDPTGKLELLSIPIDDWVSSVYTNKDSAFHRSFVYRMGDQIHFVDSGNTTSLVYDFKIKTWNLNTTTDSLNINSSLLLNVSTDFSGTNKYDWIGYKLGNDYRLVSLSDSVLSKQTDLFDNDHWYFPEINIVLPFIGDGKNMITIQEVTFTAKFPDSLILYILNHNLDTLATSFAYPVVDSSDSYTIAFADNLAKYSTISFYHPPDTGENKGGEFILNDYFIKSKVVTANETK